MQKVECRIDGVGQITAEISYDGRKMRIWGNDGSSQFYVDIPMQFYKLLEREIVASSIGLCILDGKLKVKVVE